MSAIILPRAPQGGWFPKTLLDPFEDNQPQVNEAIAHISTLLETIRGKGVALDRILLGGFAEGASVLSEFLVRNPKSYGGLMLLTGGLMDHTGHRQKAGQRVARRADLCQRQRDSASMCRCSASAIRSALCRRAAP